MNGNFLLHEDIIHNFFSTKIKGEIKGEIKFGGGGGGGGFCPLYVHLYLIKVLRNKDK